MSEANNRRKVKLGMPFGTANGRLRKNLIFNLVQKLNLDYCYRCSNKIININEFSIEHKDSWENSENPIENF